MSNKVPKIPETFKPNFSKVEPVDLKTFVEKNIFYTILVIVIVFIGYFIYLAYINWEITPIKKIKPSVKVMMITDGKPSITENVDIDCPSILTKYSFAMDMKIDDFYCNRGFWKCIFLKGNEFKNTYKNNKCSDRNTEINNTNINDCFNPDEECYKILSDNTNLKDELEKLKDLIINNSDGIKILEENSIYKRLDLICKANNIPENLGKELLCCAVSNCGFFKDSDDNNSDIKLTRGQCLKFLDQHDDYCNKVYQTDKKVMRNSEYNDNIKNNKKKKYYDDYDNVCSVGNLRQKYPELLPEFIERNSELELINLANKNNMDISNPNPDTHHVEGCYPSGSDSIFGTDMNLYMERIGEKTVQECNSEAIKKGYTHFGLKDSDSKKGTCLLINENGKDLLKKSKKISSINCSDGSSDFRLGDKNYNDIGSVYISRARRPEDLVVIKCWEDIVDNFPHQNPGVWLHPYVNNIRICLTTQTNEDYNDLKNDIIHPHKKTERYNYNIQSIEKNPSDHPGVDKDDDGQDDNSCKSKGNLKMNENKYMYREYFDLENIPIQEKFHLAIVINDKIVEVYVNAELRTSMSLFGNPYYNDGNLVINPEEIGVSNGKRDTKLKLGGVINNFKYYPYTIDSNNIIALKNESIGYQNTGEKLLKSLEEHNHNISLSHEHTYDTQEEMDHKHIVNDDDINQGYYIED